MTTTIECTKSELKARLEAEYMSPIDHAKRSGLELMDVINGLVKQANEHRGVFEGHSAYFDLDFIVHPDPTPDFTVTELIIPAVTETQREASYYAARRTVDEVASALTRMMSSELDADNLDALAIALTAASGHVRLSKS